MDKNIARSSPSQKHGSRHSRRIARGIVTGTFICWALASLPVYHFWNSYLCIAVIPSTPFLVFCWLTQNMRGVAEAIPISISVAFGLLQIVAWVKGSKKMAIALMIYLLVNVSLIMVAIVLLKASSYPSGAGP